MPPKKSKGKKGKKKEPLTEDQKKKVAEQKALAEQEKLVRRKQLTNAFLKLKKDKEYELIKLNENKLLDLWRPRLRKLKNHELLEDYKLMQHAFERAYEKKSGLIKSLENELSKNTEEYDRSIDMHMHNLDKMMEFYRMRLKEVRESFLKEQSRFLQVLNDERDQIELVHKNSMKAITDRIEEQQDFHNEISTDSKQDLFVREEEIRNKHMEEMHALKVNLQHKMNKIWSDAHQRLISYEMSSNQKRQEYIALKERDEDMSAQIDSQFRKLYALREGINQIDNKNALFETAFNNFMNELKIKKAEYREIYNMNTNRQKRVLLAGKDAIRHLALVSRNTIERVDAMVKQREKILTGLERCRRGERLDERVNPFLLRWGNCNLFEFVEGEMRIKGLFDEKSMDKEDNEEKESGGGGSSFTKVNHEKGCSCDPCDCGAVQEPDEFNPMIKLMQNFVVMEKFWKRLNRVIFERSSLKLRLDALKSDNLNLRLTLRNYMGGLNPLCQDLVTFPNEIVVNPDFYLFSNLSPRTKEKMIHKLQVEYEARKSLFDPKNTEIFVTTPRKLDKTDKSCNNQKQNVVEGVIAYRNNIQKLESR